MAKLRKYPIVRVPKEMKSLIKLPKQKGLTRVQPNMKGRRSTVSYHTDLPPIPKPTPNLKKVLIEFNTLSNDKGYAISKLSLKKSKRNLNGFMAFRSFYSRSIPDFKTQSKLSSMLSRIWRTEIDHEIWNRYAFEYNEENRVEDFTTWLCSALNISGESPYAPEDLELPFPVQDIFLRPGDEGFQEQDVNS